MVKTKMTSGITRYTIENMVDVYELPTSTGARVRLFMPKSELGPEEIAMLQAASSRSKLALLERFIMFLEHDEIGKRTKNIVAKAFTGYGHKSIGDLGHILLDITGVSMLTAKAVQDSQLYSGQEGSTRYISFAKQPFLFPVHNYPSFQHNEIEYHTNKLLEAWRTFFTTYAENMLTAMKRQHPLAKITELDPSNDDDQRTYNNAMGAATFDRMRGFLPAGCATNLVWYTSLSHAIEHLENIRNHVLPEVREVSQVIWKLCTEILPHSFKGREKPAHDTFMRHFYEIDYYLRDLYDDQPSKEWLIDEDRLVKNWKPYLCDSHLTDGVSGPPRRRRGTQLPYQIGEVGNIRWQFLLDFGSFRDVQRHRAVVQEQGLLTEKFGIHPWYLQELQKYCGEEAIRDLYKLFAKQESTIGYLRSWFKMSDEDLQYLLPMGYQVPLKITGSLSKMLYLIELRATKSVHPTLHQEAYALGVWVQKQLSTALDVDIKHIPVYAQPYTDDIYIQRGKQTITLGGKNIK